MDEDDFIAAIADDPDDVGAWLVYADWLQESGDPRGEFLALQVEFEQSDPEERDRRTELLEGLKRLELEHGDLSGMGSARSLVAEFCFGLVTGVRGSAPRLLAVDDNLRRHPVRAVSMQRFDTAGGRFARSTMIGRARELAIHLPHADPRSQSEVRAVEVHESRVFLETLRTGRELRITALKFTNYEIDAELLHAIGELPCRLRSLTLGACQLDLARLAVAVDAPALAELERLDLSTYRGELIEGSAGDLRCLQRLPELREIVISGTDLLAEAVEDELPGVRVVP